MVQGYTAARKLTFKGGPTSPNRSTRAIEHKGSNGEKAEHDERGFFQGPVPLYATQIFIPRIDANDGPRAFNLAGRVPPRRWAVVYRGKVSPPETGRFHFVGVGDDFIVVRFNGKSSWMGARPLLRANDRTKNTPRKAAMF